MGSLVSSSPFPLLSERSWEASRCRACWHRSDPGARRLGGPLASRGFARASARAISSVRKLRLAGDQAWQRPSTTASAARPGHVPARCGRGAAGRIRGSPLSCEVSCRLGLPAQRGPDPLQAPWHRARPGREIWVLPEMLNWRWWEGRGAEIQSQTLFGALHAVVFGP